LPIYEYRCRNCGRVTEFLEGVGKERESPRCCRYCGETLLVKIMSVCSVHNTPFSPERAPKKEPEKCPGNWPTNDDYIRLPID